MIIDSLMETCAFCIWRSGDRGGTQSTVCMLPRQSHHRVEGDDFQISSVFPAIDHPRCRPDQTRLPSQKLMLAQPTPAFVEHRTRGFHPWCDGEFRSEQADNGRLVEMNVAPAVSLREIIRSKERLPAYRVGLVGRFAAVASSEYTLSAREISH